MFSRSNAARRICVALLAACAASFVLAHRAAASAARPGGEGAMHIEASAGAPAGLDDPRAVVEAVLPAVARLRGLEFKRAVPVEVVDDAQAREYMLARIASFDLDSQIEATGKAYELLGLVEPGTDVLGVVLDALREQAGGFYDPKEKAFYLLDDLPPGVASVVVAHELTHALEDQHFDLDARMRDVADDDDRSFALGAVHEGSATLIMSLFLAQGVLEGTVDAAAFSGLDEGFGAAGLSAGMPPALLRELVGPYLLGPGFLTRGAPAGGLTEYPVADADRAFRDGPSSSEQILHPEKYWDPARFDPPRTVRLDGTGSALGRGWSKRGEGVLGELILALVAGGNTATDPAALLGGGAAAWTNGAASGWGGDRWELWTRRRSSVLLLRTVWDTPADAEEFAAALPRDAGLRWLVSGDSVGVLAGRPPKRAAAVLERLVRGPDGSPAAAGGTDARPVVPPTPSR